MPNHQNDKILFVVKERQVYGGTAKAYGLLNSCKFVAETLSRKGIPSEVVSVVDNNFIDAEVARFKPKFCFIEAVWVVPSKFEVLAELHPNVNWIIRIHSMVPFLAAESFAFEWLNDYIELRKKGIKISLSCNNKRLYNDIQPIFNYVSYTPNIYIEDTEPSNLTFDFSAKDTINIGCFGALRPLKNTVKQAILAIKFANEINKHLKFHINISEYEQASAGPTLKNLREVFSNISAELVEHPWYDHNDFLKLVGAMDIGMQLSLSETFNITAADFVSQGIPIVVSKEIEFIDDRCRVDVHSDKEAIKALRYAYYKSFDDGRVYHQRTNIVEDNREKLQYHNKEAARAWITFMENS